ncbi:helix-turn-helix transcriptional regulator [Corallococcus sp. Z5C101001]|uniref:ArsR/SmtB family transcription factor n=1 Tax=Corallococcus sp. Z5C101001 TaxID=2596829 RepID=UPI001C8FA3E3|nr:winged helix-turn-helix domain-containing protein [Corallococcus sp. Z5C101001]
MLTDPDIASVAMAVGEPSRAAMLVALLEGPPLAAQELARRAGVSAQTASSHLARLVEARFLTSRAQGRQRLFQLAGPEVVTLLEALAVLAPRTPTHLVTDGRGATALREARTCYDHLAGRLGIRVTDFLLEREFLRLQGDAFQVTRAGDTWLRDFGISLDGLRAGRRPLTRACLDWSERRPHLAGALGAALTKRFFERGWLTRLRGTRAVRLTERGQVALRGEWGMSLAERGPASWTPEP